MSSEAQTGTMFIEELANDYSSYLKKDIDCELKGVHESIEEMQLRLEEFVSILTMIKSKNEKSVMDNLPTIHAIQPKVMTLCKRIEALDLFIAKANLDLATLEANMEMIDSSSGSLESKFAILNPFSYFKKSGELSPTSNQSSHQEINIFKTEDFFKNNS